MAASGFTPIQLYRSATPGAVPTAANLAPGELALNTADQKLFFENASGVVVSIDTANGTVTSVNASGGTTGLTFSGGPITTSGTLTLAGTLAVANGGTGVTSSTGTVAVVLSNSPVLVTPTLGAASATSIANGLGAVGTPSYTFTGDTNTGMWSPAADTIAFSEGGVEAMRITAAGLVGIGTAAPTGTLEVSQVGTATAAIQITATSGTNPYLAFTDSLGTAAIAGGTSGTLLLRAGGAGAGDNKVYVLSSGNVGIGAASPSERLLVNGNIRLPDSNNIYWGGTANYITGSNASNFLALGTNSSERMRIDSSGNVGIGTSSPVSKLSVIQTGAGYGSQATNSGTIQIAAGPASLNAGGGLEFLTSTFSNGYGWKMSSIDSSGVHLVFGNRSDSATWTERMRITDTGNVGIGTSTINARLSLGALVSNKVFALYDDGTNQYGMGIAGSQYRMFAATGASLCFGNYARSTDTFTETVRIDSSGNVGIGTSAPGNRLDIVSATSSQIRVKDGVGATSYYDFGRDGTDGFFGFSGAQTTFSGYKWSVNAGTEVMRITNAGNVGIGTSSPSTSQILTLNSGGTATPANGGLAGLGIINTDVTASGTTGILGNLTDPGGTGRHAAAIAFGKDGTWTTGSAYPGNIQFWTRPNSTASEVERLRIDSSGNVGIGTASPGSRLDVSSSTFNIVASRSTGGYAAFQRIAPSGQNAYDFYTINGVEAARITVDGSNIMAFATGSAATERMRIDSNGRVGIGTSAPSYTFQVNALSGSNNVAYFVNDSVGSTLAGIVASIESGGNNTNSFHFAGVTQTVALWYLYGNGTTSYTSDIRVKKNVTTTRDGYLEDVCKLRVVKYNWYNDSDDTPRELGFIAQEVEQVFPGLVQDAMHPTKDGEIHKVLKGSVMMPIMLKALQEASAKIDALTARVAQLEGN